MKVACPGCGTKQPKRGPDAIYRCVKCGAMFDDDPEEGGDYHQDPSRRLELQEERLKTRRR